MSEYLTQDYSFFSIRTGIIPSPQALTLTLILNLNLIPTQKLTQTLTLGASRVRKQNAKSLGSHNEVSQVQKVLYHNLNIFTCAQQWAWRVGDSRVVYYQVDR